NTLIMAGDLVRAEANTQRTTNSTSYTKMKEFRVFASGKVRVKWEQCQVAGDGYVYSKIYRNGVAVSGENKQTSSNWLGYSYDLDVTNGDYIQVYCKVADSATTLGIRNVKLCYTVYGGEVASPIVTLD
ncbi:MAG: hypothetical protein ACTSQA_03025, partial [Candidatus Heimdallarchaeaceae archaeon]